MLGTALSVMMSGCSTVWDESPTKYAFSKKGLALPQKDQLYTAYNIYYTDPMNISSLGYYDGEILPFGAKVDVIKAMPGFVIFKTAGNKEFMIENDDTMSLTSDKIFYGRLFTVKPPLEISEGISGKTLASIRSGTVEVGMDKKDVILAMGFPEKTRTPSMNDETWIYPRVLKMDIRIIFRGNKVLYILK